MPRLKVLVASAAAASLLVGVVVVRGGTAAGESDLVARPEPSPAPSVEGPGPLVLEANGFPGLRLGTAGTAVSDVLDVPELACDLGSWDGAAPPGGAVTRDLPDVQTLAWLVDGEVASVVVSTWQDPETVSTGLATWLGPTLGSPIEAAGELPGARTERHTPFGADGPTVTVVVVPVNGVEVVFGDAPSNAPYPSGEGADAHRITSIELRRPAAVVCDLFALVEDVQQGDEVLLARRDGIGAVGLGASADQLVAEGVLLDPDGAGGSEAQVGACRWYQGVDRRLNAETRDGRVVSVSAWGSALTTDFGIPTDASAEQLRAAFPELAGRSEATMLGSGVELELDGVVVQLALTRERRPVPDLEAVVEGGEARVGGITVRSPAEGTGDVC